ncbi:MAG: hypothetical protein WC484_03215 [Candidatus Omnitrophota bacterium]
MTMISKWFPCGVLAVLPFSAMAQEAEEAGGAGYRLVESLLPMVFLFLGLYVILKLSMKRNNSYQQRAVEHMERLEQKYDKIIDLLAKLADKAK